MAQAKKGDKVKVHYKGLLQDGTVFDTSFEREPLEFTIGENQVIGGFETAVEGMDEGETKTIQIGSNEAYGPYREDLAVEVEKERLPEDLKPEVGMVLQVPTEGGQPVNVTVTEINDQTITLDGNHPLAGKDLEFEIKLEEVE
ncbi:MAG: FKBP-type peptidyl-prolyl cis-trans isomerase [Desulfovibrionales bacterium]